MDTYHYILEKEMATHSSILAWRIPWTEEFGGLQSTGRKESDTTEQLHLHFTTIYGNIPLISLMAQMVKRVPTVRETRFDPWIGKIPWRRKWQPLQYSCLENPMDRGAW